MANTLTLEIFVWSAGSRPPRPHHKPPARQLPTPTAERVQLHRRPPGRADPEGPGTGLLISVAAAAGRGSLAGGVAQVRVPE